jgi:hypothetical protein
MPTVVRADDVPGFPNPDFRIRFYVDFAGTPTGTEAPTFEVIDNGPGDSSLAFNNIFFTGPVPTPPLIANIGPFLVELTAGTTNSPGTPTISQIFIREGTIINTDTTSSHTLHVLVTSGESGLPPGNKTGGYSAPVSPPDLHMMLTSSGSVLVDGRSTASGVYEGYAGLSNALFEESVAAPDQPYAVPGGPGGASFSNTSSTDFATPSPYSLTIRSLFAINARGVVTGSTGSLTVMPIPGPGGLALALAGLPFLGVTWLRRRGK